MALETQQKEVKNNSLLALMRELSNSFLGALDQQFSPDYGSWYDRAKAILEGGPDVVARILEKRPELQEGRLSSCLVIAEKCLKYLETEKSIATTPPHALSRTDYIEELSLFLARILAERSNLQERAAFARPEALAKHVEYFVMREYLRYERYLYDDSASEFVIAPISNLVCRKELALAGGVKVRKITYDEFHDLSDAEERRGSEPTFYPETIVYLPSQQGAWENQLVNVVTAVRLATKENIGLTAVYFGHGNPCRSWDVMVTPLGTGAVPGSLQKIAQLTDPEETELKDLYLLIEKVGREKFLILSMRRFNLAHERGTTEDRWIDYFVALESLFSKGDELTEVGHRLATRVARALDPGSTDSKKKLRKKVRDWYTKRSPNCPWTGRAPLCQ